MEPSDMWSPAAAVRGAETMARRQVLSRRKGLVRALLLVLAPEAEELHHDYTVLLRALRKAIDAEIDRMEREA